jgi:hypothetical protein
VPPDHTRRGPAEINKGAPLPSSTGSQRSFSDRIYRKDDLVRGSENGLLHDFARCGAGFIYIATGKENATTSAGRRSL